MQRLEGDRAFTGAIFKRLHQLLKNTGAPEALAPPLIIIGDSGKGESGQQTGAASFFNAAASVLPVMNASEYNTVTA